MKSTKRRSKRRKKKQTRTLDIVLIVLGVFFVLFVAAVFWAFVKTGGSEPSVLVGAVAAVVLGEIMACLRIKMGKIRAEYQQKNDEENPS